MGQVAVQNESAVVRPVAGRLALPGETVLVPGATGNNVPAMVSAERTVGGGLRLLIDHEVVGVLSADQAAALRAAVDAGLLVAPADEYADTVVISATAIAKSGPGRLLLLQVLSGSGGVQLSDGAGAGTQGLTAITTLAGLQAGDEIPFAGDGLPFVNALLVTITGGPLTLKLTVV